jgi:hypothetical protein
MEQLGADVRHPRSQLPEMPLAVVRFVAGVADHCVAASSSNSGAAIL